MSDCNPDVAELSDLPYTSLEKKLSISILTFLPELLGFELGRPAMLLNSPQTLKVLCKFSDLSMYRS